MSASPRSSLSISDDQIQFFRKNGYLAIDEITTSKELDRMRIAYDEIFVQQAGREEGMEFDLAGTDEDDTIASLPQILNPKKYADALNNTLYEANALAISIQLLGEDTTQRGCHAIFKPARFGAPTP